MNIMFHANTPGFGTKLDIQWDLTLGNGWKVVTTANLTSMVISRLLESSRTGNDNSLNLLLSKTDSANGSHLLERNS